MEQGAYKENDEKNALTSILIMINYLNLTMLLEKMLKEEMKANNKFYEENNFEVNGEIHCFKDGDLNKIKMENIRKHMNI
jgi:hypothetical protein